MEKDVVCGMQVDPAKAAGDERVQRQDLLLLCEGLQNQVRRESRAVHKVGLSHATAATEVVDPVCGMTISPEDAVGHVTHDGQTYYFCNESCLDRFRDDPEQFSPSEAGRRARLGGSPSRIHLSDAPGGAAERPGLMPDLRHGARAAFASRLDEQPNEELIDMTRRFWWSLALTAPILAFMISEFLPGMPLHRAAAGAAA